MTNNSGGRVMIVDDDANVRFTVKVVLKDAGFEVISVENGMKCIEYLKEGFSGVILLDIMMPEMDGWDTIQAILDNGLETGIVISMLTAKDKPDNKMIGLQEHVFDYLTKPFMSEDLIRRVAYYMSFVNQNDKK